MKETRETSEEQDEEHDVMFSEEHYIQFSVEGFRKEHGVNIDVCAAFSRRLSDTSVIHYGQSTTLRADHAYELAMRILEMVPMSYARRADLDRVPPADLIDILYDAYKYTTNAVDQFDERWKSQQYKIQDQERQLPLPLIHALSDEDVDEDVDVGDAT